MRTWLLPPSPPGQGGADSQAFARSLGHSCLAYKVVKAFPLARKKTIREFGDDLGSFLHILRCIFVFPFLKKKLRLGYLTSFK
jgi:hypothetical protein